MTQRLFERWTAWVVPHLPKRFRDGAMPYLFFVIWLLIIFMFAMTAITPSTGGVPLTLVEALFLLVLQLFYIYGLSIRITLNLGLLGSLALVLGQAILAGGIFSSVMAWLVVIPIISFYAQSRRAGFVWLGIVLLADVLMAYVTREVLHPNVAWLRRKMCVRFPATRWSHSSWPVFRFFTTNCFKKPMRPAYNATAL
jgi:hypothetical protein